MSRWRSLLAVTAVGLFVGGFYLSVYVLNTFETPIGWDVPKYLWRTSLASEVGVTGLPDRVPPPVNASPDRPGYPLVSLALEDAVPGGELVFAAALPIVGLAALGLAAGALLVVGFGRPWWQGAVGAAFVGSSSLAVRLAGPEAYIDNILAGAVLLAALVLLASRAGSAPVPGRLVLAPVALLVAGAAIHWAFFAVVWLSIAGALAWRRRGWFGPHAGGRGRAIVVVLVASVAGAALVYLALGAWPNPPVIHEGEFSKKLTDTLGRIDLLLIPLAAVGVFAAARRRTLLGRPWESFAQDVLLVWLGGSSLAVVLKLAGLPIPAHRLVAFALPLPIFAFLGAVTIGTTVMARLGRNGSSTGRRAGPAVAGLLLGASAFLALDTWTETHPSMEVRKTEDAMIVEHYLDAMEVPVVRPLVLIVEDLGDNPDFTIPLMAHTLRTQLDPARIPNTYVYVGDPEAFLEGRVDVLRQAGSERRDGVAWRFMRDLRPVLDDDPVAVITTAYNATHFAAWAEAHGDTVLQGAVGLAVIQGPLVPPEDRFSVIGRLPRLQPTAIAFACLAAGFLLLLAGAAWTFGARPRVDRFPAWATWPAVGIAAIVLVGLVADLLVGQPLAGTVTAPLAVALGLGASLLARRRKAAA